MSSVPVAGFDLQLSKKMKVLGVVLAQRLTFNGHISADARACNYHAQAIHHIRHLLTTDLAQTLACSLILWRVDYCSALLYGAPFSSIQKLQRVQNNAARIVMQASRRSVTLATYSPTCSVQAGNLILQDPCDVNTNVPQPSSPYSELFADLALL